MSGCAALLLSKYPQLTNVEVKMRLKESARDLRLPPNWQGWGMPDVERLLWPARRLQALTLLQDDHRRADGPGSRNTLSCLTGINIV